jgi:two-component system, LytTR family, sensor kinase
MKSDKILKESKTKLEEPLVIGKRGLLLYFNISYSVLLPMFLVMAKEDTGDYVPTPWLWMVYIPVFSINIISTVYNLLVWFKRIPSNNKLDNVSSVYSIIGVLVMSFFNLIEFGNPSTDSMITDYSLATSMIIAASVLAGRRTATIWTILVVGTLIYHVDKKGWDFQFHYQTPAETIKYTTALKKKEVWALERKKVLEQNQLASAKMTRYASTWIIFIVSAFLVSYFYTGNIRKLYGAIPGVIANLEKVIEEQAQEDIMKLQEIAQIAEERRVVEVKKNEIEKKALQAQFAYLQYQFNPHFLNNSLHGLHSMSLNYEVADLSEIILKLSELLRYGLRMTDQKNDTIVTVYEEIKNISNYIDIYRLRLKTLLQVIFTVEGEMGEKKIMPLILMSFVENAFKHGKLKDEENPIEIRIKIKGEQLFFNIKNRKVYKKNRGENRQVKKELSGIGLQNTQRRLDLYYGDTYEMQVIDRNDFYHVFVRIPLK